MTLGISCSLTVQSVPSPSANKSTVQILCFWTLSIVLFLFKRQRFEDLILSPSSGRNFLSWAQSIELFPSHLIWQGRVLYNVRVLMITGNSNSIPKTGSSSWILALRMFRILFSSRRPANLTEDFRDFTQPLKQILGQYLQNGYHCSPSTCGSCWDWKWRVLELGPCGHVTRSVLNYT
jgi:hypothetical protein